jgi:hypothetical protein
MYFRHLKDPGSLLSGVSAADLTRRDFLKFTTLAGAGLTLGALLPSQGAAAAGSGTATPPFAMPFVHIDPDNTVTVLAKHVEAGQGVWTGLPTIVADELDASWEQMRVEGAPAKVPMYGNFAFDPKGSVQGTGGSTAVATRGCSCARRAPPLGRCWCRQPRHSGRYRLPRSPSLTVWSVTRNPQRRRGLASWPLAPPNCRFPPM